jgi:hypothetical protein
LGFGKPNAGVWGLRNDAVVATSAKRYELRLQSQRREQNLIKQVGKMLNCKM